MGSEMCIRDRVGAVVELDLGAVGLEGRALLGFAVDHVVGDSAVGCLLYTSDAADERSSVDLGGRRIIKKKKTSTIERETTYENK